MHWTDDSAAAAALARQCPPMLRAGLHNAWSSVRRPPGARATVRQIRPAVRALWPVWLGLLIVVVVLAWRYAAEIEARLYARSVTDGRVRWSAELPPDSWAAGNPSIGDGLVVVGLMTAEEPDPGQNPWQVTAYDAASGRVRWAVAPWQPSSGELDIRRTIILAPVASSEHVFVAANLLGRMVLYALEPASGQVTWQVDSISYGAATREPQIAVASGRVFVSVTTSDGYVIRALDGRDGRSLWSTPIGSKPGSASTFGPDLVATADTVYVGLHQRVIALDAVTGAARFSLGDVEDETPGETIAVSDGLLFRKVNWSQIEADDVRNGEIRWTYTAPEPGLYYGMSARNGILVAICDCDGERIGDHGWLVGIETATGQERWRSPLENSFEMHRDRPVFAGDLVLTGTENQYFLARGADVVARSAADGSVRWALNRRRDDPVATDGSLFAITDAAPRWRHWLAWAGLLREP